MMKNIEVKPALKWAGGKRRLIPDIRKYYKEIRPKKYIEPFFGGGSVYFDIPAMPVDTHVFRVSERIGLTINATNPLQAELQLLKLFPKKKLNIAHHWLILHGRYVCKSRKPDCLNCGITNICKYYHH